MRGIGEVRLCTLSEAWVLVPVTDELHDALLVRFPAPIGRPYSEFWKLSASLVEFARAMSIDGAVVYVETDYFGGVGTQASIAWRSNRVVYGPSKFDDSINDALSTLGVSAGLSADEFQQLGLQRHRHTTDWFDEGEPAA